MAFGDFAQSVAIPRTTTSSTTWTTVVTLNMPPETTAGDYYFVYTHTFQTQNNNSQFEARMLVDGVTLVGGSRILQETIPGNNPAADTRDGHRQFGTTTLTAGAHTVEFQIQANGIGSVTVDNGVMSVWKLDNPTLFYTQAVENTGQVTSLGSYQFFMSTGPLVLAAGIYRVLWVLYCQNNQEASWPGTWFRRIEDPGGANTVVNMYGANAAASEEAYCPPNDFGTTNADPSLPVQWTNSCIELEAGTYEFEMLFRRRPGQTGNVRVDNGKIGVMQLPPDPV